MNLFKGTTIASNNTNWAANMSQCVNLAVDGISNVEATVASG